MLLLCLLRSKISPVLVPACYRKTRWWQQVQSGILQSCSRLGILQNNLGHWGKYEVKEREGLVFHSQCLLFYVHSGKKNKKTEALRSTKPIRFFAQECLNQWRNWRHPAEIEAGQRTRSKPTYNQTYCASNSSV